MSCSVCREPTIYIHTHQMQSPGCFNQWHSLNMELHSNGKGIISLSLVDAYLRQTIEVVKSPFTRICMKSKGVRFNRQFCCYKWTVPMSISVQV